MDARYIVIGGLLSIFAWLFQLLPVVFSEVFIFTTILSSIPVYIGGRIQPRIGVMIYLIAGFLIFILSPHEGLFFLFTNGVVGLSIGVVRYYTENRFYIGLISGGFLTISLSIMVYLLDILVFGISIPGNILVQLIIIFGFSLLYCSIINVSLEFIYKRVKG